VKLIWIPYEREKSEKNALSSKNKSYPFRKYDKNAPFRPFSAIKYAIDYASITLHNIKGFNCRNWDFA
jgi:hypothetical protein